jgi:hypothetical protein
MAITPVVKRVEYSVRRKDYLLLLITSIFGAAIAPTMFFFGLKLTTAIDGSLLSNGEVIFSILLALTVFGEKLNRIGIMESERVRASDITWKKDDMSGYVRSIILSRAFPIFIELQNLLFKSTRQSSQITSSSWDSGVNCLPQSIHIFMPPILFLTPCKTAAIHTVVILIMSVVVFIAVFIVNKPWSYLFALLY